MQENRETFKFLLFISITTLVWRGVDEKEGVELSFLLSFDKAQFNKTIR